MAARRRRGLPPVVGGRPLVLIVGSLPGEASLRARQYYAHPQNQFWTILGELAGASKDLAYDRRLARLVAARIALWDVARTCLREASSDASMRDVVPNDFVRLFRASPTLATVLCNGGKAHAMFVRLVLPALARAGITPVVARLPSTSPAHASLRPAEKLARWREALAPSAARG